MAQTPAANNNGTLQLNEAQEALKWLTKPSKGGDTPTVAVAYPSALPADGAEVNLPFAWFWAQYQAMD